MYNGPMIKRVKKLKKMGSHNAQGRSSIILMSFYPERLGGSKVSRIHLIYITETGTELSLRVNNNVEKVDLSGRNIVDTDPSPLANCTS
jgi:hypothetical protein